MSTLARFGRYPRKGLMEKMIAFSDLRKKCDRQGAIEMAIAFRLFHKPLISNKL
jgi:hypothetical protein